jgi:hypothetical protein
VAKTRTTITARKSPINRAGNLGTGTESATRSFFTIWLIARRGHRIHVRMTYTLCASQPEKHTSPHFDTCQFGRRGRFLHGSQLCFQGCKRQESLRALSHREPSQRGAVLAVRLASGSIVVLSLGACLSWSTALPTIRARGFDFRRRRLLAALFSKCGKVFADVFIQHAATIFQAAWVCQSTF